MKHLKNLMNIGWFWVLLLLAPMLYTACSSAGSAQSSTQTDAANLIQNRRFAFVPQTVNPMGGRTRQLTGEFFLRVTPDTVQSYLPYFGRAFSAPMTPGQGAMDFTVTNFEFSVTPGRNNRQTISIRPREGTDVRELILQVYPNGNASLQALSNNRQPISYNGAVQSIRR